MTDANLLGPIPLSIFLMRGQRLFSLPGRRRAGPRCSAALRDGDRIACQGSLVAWAAGEGPRAGITCFQLGPALPLFLAASHPREHSSFSFCWNGLPGITETGESGRGLKQLPHQCWELTSAMKLKGKACSGDVRAAGQGPSPIGARWNVD